MSITGGIKFFEKSVCLLKDGASVVVSSGDVVADYLLDTNPLTYWNSVESTDLVTESIFITFPQETEISRIFILDHNFKDLEILYLDPGTGNPTQIGAGVVGLSGSAANNTDGLIETTWNQNTSYYEFTPIRTSQIRIYVVTTQVANAEKYCSQIIATNELGTLVGFPNVKSMEPNNNAVENKMLSGKMNVVKGYDAFACKIKFDNYPASLSADLDLAMSLFDSQNPFLMWLCGGKFGSTRFLYTLRGFRLQDVIQCQTSGKMSQEYYKNVYTSLIDLELKIMEHV